MNRDELRESFRARGESIRDWAARNNFQPGLVYAVISGRIRGDRGKAHYVAVALGLKPPATAAAHQELESDLEAPMT